jgi:Domain of unknown function (DUF4185)
MKCLAFPLLLMSFASGSLASHSLAQSPDPELPDFKYADGWLGADGAYSVPLATERTVWLFGDTFVGTNGAKSRNEVKTMIRNSVGISHCVPKRPCTLEYFWQRPASALPRSFFDSGKEEIWYWPLDGFAKDHALYVSLLVVRNKPGATPSDAFGFEIAGTKLATVENIRKSPDQWHITMRDLTDSRLWPGVSLVPEPKYVMWYTQVSTGEGKGYMAVMRVPQDKMANPSGNWEYLRKDNQWAQGLAGEDALRVIDQPISEMSVRYHPSIKKWVAVSTGPEFPSPRAVARTADTPVGPWSAPQTIYEFPEMKRENPGYDKDIFCYAVKEHTEFTSSKIALTYACNSLVLAKTIANMDIYRPRVVILELPK